MRNFIEDEGRPLKVVSVLILLSLFRIRFLIVLRRTQNFSWAERLQASRMEWQKALRYDKQS